MESGEVTKLLRAYGDGDRSALDRLVPVVYAELRRIARAQLRDEAGDRLQTTALVHEAYVRLADADTLSVEDLSHFLSIAARAMRRILIDDARRRTAQKRGGRATHVTLDSRGPSVPQRDEDLVALDEALERLSKLNPRQSSTVEYKIFAGMTVEEIARALSVSPRTVKRDWQAARAWLNRELSA
ncbi:MAG: sigma-70 family RNA polymerase sigma factor [Longimicrobiales bacterium]|nr:sigma-70 family RNA polymerase sigma factor [Longimicrobiales bacterium]